MESLTRTVLLVALLGAYVAATVRPAAERQGGTFDALSPGARFVERAIGEQRFSDALPVALDLQRTHGGEPLVAYWLATIYHGLGRDVDARTAWDEFHRLTAQPGLTAD